MFLNVAIKSSSWWWGGGGERGEEEGEGKRRTCDDASEITISASKCDEKCRLDEIKFGDDITTLCALLDAYTINNGASFGHIVLASDISALTCEHVLSPLDLVLSCLFCHSATTPHLSKWVDCSGEIMPLILRTFLFFLPRQ